MGLEMVLRSGGGGRVVGIGCDRPLVVDKRGNERKRDEIRVRAKKEEFLFYMAGILVNR